MQNIEFWIFNFRQKLFWKVICWYCQHKIPILFRSSKTMIMCIAWTQSYKCNVFMYSNLQHTPVSHTNSYCPLPFSYGIYIMVTCVSLKRVTSCRIGYILDPLEDLSPMSIVCIAKTAYNFSNQTCTFCNSNLTYPKHCYFMRFSEICALKFWITIPISTYESCPFGRKSTGGLWAPEYSKNERN